MSEATQTSPDYGRRDGGGGAAAVVTDASAVSVGMTEGRGRGLFASKAMAKGDTVLIERCDAPPPLAPSPPAPDAAFHGTLLCVWITVCA